MINIMWKLVSAILLVCKEITAEQLLDNTYTKYDLTDIINNAIFRLLVSTDLVEKFEPLINMKDGQSYGGVYKINNTRKLRPFKNTIQIKHTHALGSDSTFRQLFGMNPSTCTIRWEFHKNKLNVSCYEREYWISGCIGEEESPSYWISDQHYSRFRAKYHVYKNLSITATKLSENQSDDKDISVDLSYGHLKNLRGITLEQNRKLSYEQCLKLIYIIGLELPSIMRELFNVRVDFRPQLGKIFNLHPKQYMISACPDFSTNEQRYYYRLPDISLIRMSFKNITIRGLSNFESYYANDESRNDQYSSNVFVYTLHVKNVGGNMTLDPGLEHASHFQLNFFIRNLYISFVSKNAQFSVEARDYRIVEDIPQPTTLISSWLSKYSTGIIQLIESSVTHSIALSQKIQMVQTGEVKSISSSPQIAEMETSFAEVLKNFASR